MFLNGIDFPNNILDALENDRLVVFAGAGASFDKPTLLPSFENLAKEIAEDTGEVLRKNEACEVFLGRLKAKSIDVNKIAADILSGSCIEHNKLHEAIVELFKTHESIKIVTTNYDQMFEQVIDLKGVKVPVYNVPAIPLGNDINGIVHIHGNVDNPKYMVLTDEDFGRAYLTEGYASKFLVQLFESYTVLFIGYSYNDTILRYLTRAISRSAGDNRYIITDDRKSEWSVLGVKPVFFPKNSFAVMREGLVKLGNCAKKGLVEWKNKFEDICETPPMDLTVDTEIDYCLENIDRSKVLANSVKGKKWLELLDRKEVFLDCFSEEVNNPIECDLWAAWLCKNFVGRDDSTLLSLFFKHKNIISKQLANHLSFELISNTTINTNYYMKYLLALDKCHLENNIIVSLIEVLKSREQYRIAFSLLKKLFACNMELETKIWVKYDAINYKHSFVSEYYYLNSSWKMIKDNAVNIFPYEVILFVVEKILELHLKYVMAGQVSKDTEPMELLMIDIEGRDEIYRDDPIKLLSDIFTEASNSLEKQNKDLLRTTLLQCVNSESILLRKIALKVIREVHILSAEEQLNIILSKELLDDAICKEQVFLMAAVFFIELSSKDKDKMLDAIEQLKSEDDKRNSIYKIYNWCIWLQRFDHSNQRLNRIIDRILSKNKFQPREHPELSTWSSSIKWVNDQSPLSEEELIRLPISEAVNKIANYEGNSYEGPSRIGLLNVFSSCLSNNAEWSKDIIHTLIDNRVDFEDVWQHFFYGIREANYSLEDVLYVLQLIDTSIDIVGDLNAAAEYLWKVLQRTDIAGFFIENEQIFCRVSETIWNHRKKDKYEFSRTIDATLNTTVGSIILSWIYMVSLFEERCIPKNYRKYFEEALNMDSWERNVAICILVGHFNFFCYRDMEWSIKTLTPYLTSNSKTLYENAWEGMVFFSRRINKDTADIISPICYKAIKHIEWLENRNKKGFVELLLTLMIYVIERPTRNFIPEFYRKAPKEDRKLLIKAIENRLKNMDESSKIEWWNSWLKRFIENRKYNKPFILEDEENEAIMNLIIVLPEIFDEAVDVVCRGKAPKHADGLFWHRLNDMQIDKSKMHSMVKLLVKVLENLVDPLSGVVYIKEIVGKLRGLDSKDRDILQEILLKRNIEVVI